MTALALAPKKALTVKLHRGQVWFYFSTASTGARPGPVAARCRAGRDADADAADDQPRRSVRATAPTANRSSLPRSGGGS